MHYWHQYINAIHTSSVHVCVYVILDVVEEKQIPRCSERIVLASLQSVGQPDHQIVDTSCSHWSSLVINPILTVS